MTEKRCPECHYEVSSDVGRLPTACPECGQSLRTLVTDGGQSTDGTGREVHSRDWECLDCGDVYCESEDATKHSLPEFCPSCGDTPGWRNRKTGRKVPDYSVDTGTDQEVDDA